MSNSVLLMNVNTREIMEFKTAKQAAKFIDVFYHSLTNKLNRYQIEKPYHGHFVKYKKDNVEWPEAPVKLKKNTKPLNIQLIHVESGRTIQHKSLNSVASSLGSSRSSISYQANKTNPKPYKGYIIQYNMTDGLNISQ